jgi:hypothetical protein
MTISARTLLLAAIAAAVGLAGHLAFVRDDGVTATLAPVKATAKVLGRDVRVRGAGEALPIASNRHPAGRARNRRVEIVVRRTGVAD